MSNLSKSVEKPFALVLMEDEEKLLGPDTLSTLLLFLFVDNPKINLSRLYRIIRYLCYHAATREWIIFTLINIIQNANDLKQRYASEKMLNANWLNFKMDTAFGFRSKIFVKKHDNDFYFTINPQAAHLVIKNTLDLLLVLAKHFPHSFVPVLPNKKVSLNTS